MPSSYQAAMTVIVGIAAPVLKAAGFGKRRHTFNRPLEPGLVHVVNFQMGPFDPPGTEEFPPIRRNRYGHFTVNLGVFIKEVAETLHQVPASSFVPEYACEIRARLGSLMPDHDDLWWSLDDDPAQTGRYMVDLLERYALPYLDRFHSRLAVIEEWLRHGQATGFAPRGDLSVAVMLKERDDIETAKSLVNRYLARDDHPPGHVAWARQRAEEIGLLPRR